MKQLFCLLLISVSGFSQTTAPLMTDRAAARFLDQATWGPTPESIAALQTMGITKWLELQFSANASDLPDQPLLNSAGTNNTNLAPVQAAFIQNTVNGPDQLRQRTAFMLSEIWVVSQTTVPQAYAFPPYWRIFRDNAFRSYRDVLKAVTLSPAMGTYLNMANNNKANASKGTAANENYARELMQLFTLGLNVLNPDGSPVLDSSKNPVPTYTQAQVTQVAKVITGWTYPTAPGATAKNNNPAYYFGRMHAVEAEHDTTSKAIFNHLTIPAGQTAEQDLEMLFDDLMAQPTMAPFVSQQLIQHMVSSNPSAAYVQRVAQVFTSTDGDMKSVITAILSDPEARAGDAGATVNASFGHLREPILFFSSMLRGLNATVGPSNTLNSYTQELGQNLFIAPSVFSYFSPQNQIEGGLLGPEFQIHSTQTAADRANIISGALYGTLDKTTTVDLSPFVSKAGTVSDLVSYIGYVFVHSGMSPALTQAATAAANAQSTALAKAQAALYVVLTSNECQVVH
jgi:uncharacterized protein (DUF1800 family)